MKLWDKTKDILVVMGGPSTEAEVSRRTGAAIAQALAEGGYKVTTLEFNPRTFLNDVQKVQPQVVFNALHGKYGEDGAIQNVLEMLGIPYTGSGPLASALTMDKVISKRLFVQSDLPTAPFSIYRQEEEMEMIVADILERFTLPVVIKAANQGSTIGVSVIHEASEVARAVQDAFKYDPWIVVESYLFGDEFTASVLNGEALPVIQIVPHSGVYDYASKYTAGATDYLVPAPIDNSLQVQLQELAQQTYRLMNCEGVARVDFMTDEKGNPFILEVNTVPGMTVTSLVPKAANAVGMDFLTLCEAILSTAGCKKL
ncbi:D-alanine--D-alanine ligase [Negativicoccus succinicivorans]|uniref:D-alanine--D-alanine ligase n=1 Tax=Negativicoccus succinicivorans TaxID=620903 RepID=UPI0029040FB8|nr:D-alanine--D-alanine ligase [Negativicoccus succinicivorans]MDU2417531.1 D-alanine--D-alanine ligase [Negativicoccus succinicivorans]